MRNPSRKLHRGDYRPRIKPGFYRRKGGDIIYVEGVYTPGDVWSDIQDPDPLRPADWFITYVGTYTKADKDGPSARTQAASGEMKVYELAGYRRIKESDLKPKWKAFFKKAGVRKKAKRRNRKNWGRGNVQGPLGPGPATHAGWIYDQYRNFYYNPRYTGKPIQSLSEMSDAELKKLYRTWLRAGGNGGVQKALKKEFRKRYPHKFPMKAAANPRYVSSYAKEWTLSSGGKRHPGWLKARNKRTGAVVWGKPAQFGNSAWRKRHGLPKYIAKAARRNRR